MLDPPVRLCLPECQADIDSLVCVKPQLCSVSHHPRFTWSSRNLSSTLKERQPRGSNYSPLKNDVIAGKNRTQSGKAFCVVTGMGLLCTQYGPVWPYKPSLSPAPVGGFISQPSHSYLRLWFYCEMPPSPPRLRCSNTLALPSCQCLGRSWKL